MRQRNSNPTEPALRHAVVIGGSIGGLLAARVLADHAEQVTVLERDALPQRATSRRGVPQGRHAHGLLAGGLRALEQLFPGFGAELVAIGALPGDVIGDMRWHQHGHYKIQFASGLRGVTVSRPLLEEALRKRVLALANVRLEEQVRALWPACADPGGPVRGITIERRQGVPTGSGVRETMLADLVVDASGRGSRLPGWLRTLGYRMPEQTEVAISVRYASRIYRRDPEAAAKFGNGAILAPRPPEQKRMGVMLAIEDDRWIVTLGGLTGEGVPTEDDAFVAFARSLPAPDIYDVIRTAEPLSEITTHTFPASLRRHYERLQRFPEGMLAFGDALCSFNPIYGQGMSVCALEALELRRCLQQRRRPNASLRGLAQRFYRRAARVIDTPWTLAVGADFAYPEVAGHRPLGTRSINAYLARVHRAAADDPVVCRAFFEVANLLAPPARLFRPTLLARVLAARRARTAPATAPVAARPLRQER